MLIRDVYSHAACSLGRSGTVVAKSRGWTEGVEQALTPFYYNCWGKQVKGYFFKASVHPLDHSAHYALKLLSFCEFTTAAPLQQRPSPLVTHTVLLVAKAAGQLLFHCGCLWWWTVTTSQCQRLTFGCKWLFSLSWAYLWILHQCLLFYLGFYRFIWIIYTSSFSRVRFPFILFDAPKFILIWMVPAKSRIWWSGMWYFRFHSDIASIENS